ncbi:valine--pyruvate transaminase [Spongorhabdus nitratireducens]
MKLSRFGEKFTSRSGILSLMDDLGNALAEGDKIMMGGGNPAHIPEVDAIYQQELKRIVDDQALFTRLVGTYDPPQGEKEFVRELAAYLNRHFNWNLTERNIALTNGSQSAFFMLFNMFGGEYADGSVRRIQLPMAPEYIGYADAGLSHDFFSAAKPEIELLPHNQFKYHVDFHGFQIHDTTGAICVSRPTNPTGNVITDKELEKLRAQAYKHDIPLLLDNAYGLPFPNLIFTEATPVWDENIILNMSLSKLGLPATRTGITVAREEVIAAMSGINAITCLAPGTLGGLMTLELIRDDRIDSLCNNQIKPFYQQKAEAAVTYFEKIMGDTPYRVHKPEGAMFLWLWFEGLPISSQELYERLKQRGVVVVSGHHFFPGIDDSQWAHQHECLRVTYSRDQKTVEQGLDIIAQEVKAAFSAS